MRPRDLKNQWKEHWSCTGGMWRHRLSLYLANRGERFFWAEFSIIYAGIDLYDMPVLAHITWNWDLLDQATFLPVVYCLSLFESQSQLPAVSWQVAGSEMIFFCKTVAFLLAWSSLASLLWSLALTGHFHPENCHSLDIFSFSDHSL